MTAPIWMASPPEVHSTLLSSGPGPGWLLAAAAAWNSLSAEYASIADELTSLLGAVQAGAWQGPSAESYVAAHVPYLTWLMQASANAATAAAQHETVAAAYTSALAAMPTLVELAANHATHAVLVATNFFGINTIPIALNEADYVRMWIQAAITMAIYEANAVEALAATELAKIESSPFWPPNILKLAKAYAHDTIPPGTKQIIDDDSGNPHQWSWWTNRVLEITQTLGRDFKEFPQNPLQAIGQLQTDIPQLALDEAGHALEAYQAFTPQFNALGVGLLLTNPAPLSGFPGLTGLTAIHTVEASAPAASIPVAAESSLPAVGAPLVSAAPASAPASATASASAAAPAATPTTAPASGAPPPPPAVSAAGFGYPYLVGPGLGMSSSLGTAASSGAKKKAPTPAAAVAAAAAAGEQARARRRRRAKMRGYGDEFMDMNVEVEPDWGAPPGGESAASTVASDQGAGNLGFAGTARKEAVVEASGLTTLAGDGFGGGPSVPMVPGTWEPDHRERGDWESTS
jgi:PPE-repeat protein